MITTKCQQRLIFNINCKQEYNKMFYIISYAYHLYGYTVTCFLFSSTTISNQICFYFLSDGQLTYPVFLNNIE